MEKQCIKQQAHGDDVNSYNEDMFSVDKSYQCINWLPSPHRKTVFYCTKCTVHLCINPDTTCFEKWHTYNVNDVRTWVTENRK